MGIEDMPEMQIIREESLFKPVNLAERPINLSGRFVVMRSPSKQLYLLGGQNALAHMTVADTFEQFTSDNPISRKYLDTVTECETLYGGHFRIDDSNILIYGKSDMYGKYDIDAIRPIVKRWAKDNLQEHQIEFK